MSELRLRLMGTPEVRLDGVRLSIQRRRALALLAFLAVTGRPHRREVLATLLAGDAAEAQAHKHLSNALTDLRAALGEYVVVERQTVAFDCDRPYWLDVAAIRSLLADGIPAGDVDAVQRAVDLYQDEFLAGLVLPDAPAFDEWLTLQREQLGQLLVRGLQTAIDHHACDGTADEGIAAAQRLLAEDPWREEAHRQLMALLAASGQRSAALSQYAICRRVLAEELGVEPAAETRALYERLRSEPVAAPHNLPPAPAPLVGREAELELLAQRLSEPASPVLSVVGPGGAGKSRLALECARRAATPAAGGDLPYPDGVYVVSFAETEAATAGQALPAGEATQQLAAAIADVVRAPAAGAAGAQSLVAALRPKALLLVLDDLDPLAAGVGLLADIVRQAPRVKLLLTSRQRLPLLEQSVLELHGLPRAPDGQRGRPGPRQRPLPAGGAASAPQRPAGRGRRPPRRPPLPAGGRPAPGPDPRGRLAAGDALRPHRRRGGARAGRADHDGPGPAAAAPQHAGGAPDLLAAPRRPRAAGAAPALGLPRGVRLGGGRRRRRGHPGGAAGAGRLRPGAARRRRALGDERAGARLRRRAPGGRSRRGGGDASPPRRVYRGLRRRPHGGPAP